MSISGTNGKPYWHMIWGFWVCRLWILGNLDNEYEWYVKQVDERVDIHGKLVAELKFSAG